MNPLQEFFKNPTWMSVVVVLGYFAYDLINKSRLQKKAITEAENKRKKEAAEFEKKEKSYKALDRLSDAVELLVQKETNHVNLMTAENIISAQLLNSKATIKNEIRRIFEYNHRENAQRQQVIKNAISIIVDTTFENDIKILSKIRYKSTKLADFLLDVDVDLFLKELLKLLFTTGGNQDDEKRDILYYVDSAYATYILKGKKYYNNIR